MARIFTTHESEVKAKSLMHDITVAGGIRTNSQRSGSNNFDSSFVIAAQRICKELIDRDFADIDQAINDISYFNCTTLNGNERFRLKPEAIAKAIVYMAECVNLYWDDELRTPWEVDAFQKTLLGAAVYKYGRYISAIKPAKHAKSASGGGATTANQNTVGKKSSDPRGTDPQSENVRDLQGKPHEKVYADTEFIYKIITDKKNKGAPNEGKNTPKVFIKPLKHLSPEGAAGTTNKIFISSGNAYEDFTCFFDDPNDAQAFLDKIVAADRVPKDLNNIRVAKAKAEANGYFLVGTEFGIVAISAKALKESLAVHEDINADWVQATENYDKNDRIKLHDWMRN